MLMTIKGLKKGASRRAVADCERYQNLCTGKIWDLRRTVVCPKLGQVAYSHLFPTCFIMNSA
jgi:hypothetical protein